jgi:hypothetical protein
VQQSITCSAAERTCMGVPLSRTLLLQGSAPRAWLVRVASFFRRWALGGGREGGTQASQGGGVKHSPPMPHDMSKSQRLKAPL